MNKKQEEFMEYLDNEINETKSLMLQKQASEDMVETFYYGGMLYKLQEIKVKYKKLNK